MPDENQDQHEAQLPPARKPWREWAYWVARSLVGILILAAASTGLFWALHNPDIERPIAEQWAEAIGQLGIEPVYPPQEDVAVGDVYAMITHDATGELTGKPLAGRSLKLFHLDMTPEIEATYSTTYKFTDTKPRNGSDVFWGQTEASQSVFKAETARKSLPLVLFPGFTVARIKSADASGFWSSGWLGTSASSSSSIEMKISAAETYGVPALPAEERLIAFCVQSPFKFVCTDQGARQQLSIIVGNAAKEMIIDKKTGNPVPRLTVEIGLVSRVFLTRSIESKISRDRFFSGKGRVRSGDDTEQSESNENKPIVSPPSASSGAKPNDVGAKPDDHIAALRANLAAQDKELATLKTNKGSAPGISTSVQGGDASSLTLVETLQRPVVFGFRTIRWTPQ